MGKQNCLVIHACILVCVHDTHLTNCYSNDLFRILLVPRVISWCIAFDVIGKWCNLYGMGLLEGNLYRSACPFMGYWDSGLYLQPFLPSLSLSGNDVPVPYNKPKSDFDDYGWKAVKLWLIVHHSYLKLGCLS